MSGKQRGDHNKFQQRLNVFRLPVAIMTMENYRRVHIFYCYRCASQFRLRPSFQCIVRKLLTVPHCCRSYYRIVLIIVMLVMWMGSFMARPQLPLSSVQTLAAVDSHQHDVEVSDPLHDPLIYHSHGNIHHLNADHSHELNKLFALTTLILLPVCCYIALTSPFSQIQNILLTGPERPPKLLFA